MTRAKPDRYAFNHETKEVHLLSKVKGSCNLPEGVSLYSSLETLAEGTGIERPDHCAHCFRVKFTSKPETK